MRVFLNLMAGLDRIGAAYRTNDYHHIRANPEELVCLIGKPHILPRFSARTPLLFGPSIYNHPVDDERLPSHHLVRQVLVPSAWVKVMFSKFWPDIVSVWPVGIDTECWVPGTVASKNVDVIFYDKIIHDRPRLEQTLINPMLRELRRRGLVVEYLRYGSYFEWQLLSLTRRARSMIFFSYLETQGIALEQTLSAGVPVLAWDPGGEWQTLVYLLRGIRFGPTTSVPYWDDRCGVKFKGAQDMLPAFDRFWRGVEANAFAPRELILDKKLTLEAAAQEYVALVDKFAC